ncbi:MAG: CRISPR-associated endonuclease Cas2 [Patescibacteria group bacterium]|nr:CRISPR-associated endonuclease Cas2 [Patescibacteria group bacterium]MBU2508875.1 CRISPR-associated endonuclease Cas2 [Patescibacteria group bacterium]
MKRKTKDKTKTLTKAFFDIMAVGTLVTVIVLLSQGRNANKLFKALGSYSVWRIKRMLKRQKLMGMIEYDEDDEYSPIILTKKGFTRITKDKLKRIDGKKWDHFWRLVMFDVPERKNKRVKFQRLLSQLGLYRIQKSVYVYPFECKADILCLASQFGISSDVVVLTVPNLGPHEKLARRFYSYRFLKE